MKFKRIYRKLNFHSSIKYLILFVFVFIFFLVLQGYPSFADPDSFYHAKMAEFISQQGIIFEFPYLHFTVLNNYFTDHHFLYHIFLVPFVLLLNPLVGLKIATIFFASLTIIVFYWLLKKLKIKGAIVYTLILVVTNPFIFRLNLAKAQGLAMAALFLGLYLIIQRRYLLLSLLSFLFVWLYGGWPLMLVTVSVYVIASYLQNSVISIVIPSEGRRPKSRDLTTWFKRSVESLRSTPFRLTAFAQGRFGRDDKKKILHKQNIKLLSAVVAGLLAGLIINPYFPKNLLFYWQQIVQIAVVNYQKIIGVGGEWYPYNFLELVSGSSLVFVFIIIALTIFVLYFKQQSTLSWASLILAVIFFVLTLKSRRNVEYFVPFALLFSAISINKFVTAKEFKNFLLDVKKLILQKKYLVVGIIIPISMIPYIVYRDIGGAYNDHHAGFSFSQFQSASDWLKDNSQEKSIVFHSDWDEFPLLFYHNSSNYYIVGLDPTFMYNYNEDLYWKWHNITIGQEVQNLYPYMKNDFTADYVFIELATHQLLDRNLSNNFYFEEVYKDSDTKIYKVN